MTHEIDNRPLTKEQWIVMFAGPEWDEETIEALGYSLPKAYEIHSARTKAARPPQEVGR
ncbi:hypothetical protein [Rhizobium sp. 768_B6_N1_8]|uniref:hypothetical protein n=1 Tax=unclassified Rhizobium TaxID=2613769 RepID=UPI003F1FD67F